MYLAPTEFHRAEVDEEVVALLEHYDGAALILAGGTFVHGLEARGLLRDVRALIDVGRLDGHRVEAGADGLRIGAATRCATLAADAAVGAEPWLGAVADALSTMPLQIRNAATVGGSVATACALFDLPVALAALGGRVGATGRGGTRRIDLDGFVRGMFVNALDDGEFVSTVEVPQPPDRTASAFTKLEANANDLAVVNAAVSVTLDANGDGACTAARIVVGGGVGAAPVRASSAERVLEGAALDEETLRAAGEAAADDLDPQSDHRASGGYRKRVAGVLVRRGLERALARLT